MACGLPVAAYPVQGPTDAVGGAPGAILDNDLRAACLQALAIARSPEGANSSPRTFALEHTWHKCTRQFLANLAVEPPEED
jgi:hypothetical protein